jgi:hypothetical protein
MIMHEHGSTKHQAESRPNPQSQVQPPVGIAPSTCDVKQAAPTKKCSTCGAVLERIDGCPQCGKGVNNPASGGPNIENRPFKLYVNSSSPIENDLYKMLSQAFSEKDPRERPWCGLGVEVDLLAVSPTHLTVADIKEIKGIQQAVVHVPQNWREPWYVEASGGARHQAPGNPCDQAERAISTIKHSLSSFLAAGDQPTFPYIKYLIIFPDSHGDFWFSFSRSPKKEGAGKPTPSVIDPSFRPRCYFAKQAVSSIWPGQSAGTNVVQ